MHKRLLLLAIIILFSLFLTAQDSIDEDSSQVNTEYSKKFAKDEVYIIEKYDIYIRRLNLFVTISYGVLGLFVVINLFNGNKHIKESKKELNDFKAEIKNYKETVNQLKGQRSEIINEITEYGRGIFKDYLVHYKIKAAREELETLIMVSEPDERKVFEKLSLILEHPDNLSLQLYIKCMEKFPDNTDVRRLSLRGIRIYSDKNTKPNNV